MAYTDLARCSGGKQLHPLRFNGQQLLQLMIRRLDISERRTITASELPTTPSGRDGRKQSVVSESGFYKLILRCDKKSGDPLPELSDAEVLPSTFGGPAADYALEPPSSSVQSLQVLFPAPSSQIALACLYGAHRRTSVEQRLALLVEGSLRSTLRNAALLEYRLINAHPWRENPPPR